MAKTHHYEVEVTWTGNTGTGTSGYRDYKRDHDVSAPGKDVIAGSSDPAFRGDPARWNPEELQVAAVSQCHMLWFLHLCSAEGIVVTGYTDRPHGTMVESPDGGGRFEEVVLRPEATLADPTTAARALELHERAHQLCFIANSVNFKISHAPVFPA
ncbi:OsmC family protein [Nonomuraea endophytica]|uniref:Organic hydroperoxide reductase OsmC/OhrA n=1 Tax=Nonomuraea endophytica TaxID=714136 RepID=A0A7W8AB83_9ACTN|nr:OsmC family protein [Nonomuraea endophytica]MBB5081588.1 organic hydroperoxide reductase OsmC/OhrA [Nonomuraea endophytica]